MNKEKIELLIIKFLNKEASHDELTMLDLWLRNEKNTHIFNQFTKTQYLISSSMDEFDLEKAKLNVKKKVKSNIRKKRFTLISKYAAAVVVIGLCLTPFLYNSNKDIEPAISNKIIKPGSTKAILTLNNGENVILEKGEVYNSEYSSSDDGTNLKYQQNTNNSKKRIAYNNLTVPRGGQFFVTLSDGTKVWLNSDSKIKYPTTFTSGKTRAVELVYGEAYFEVTPSTQNNGAKFTVISASQNIEVLGTKFNIKAYKDEQNTFTTLVEGSVAISNSENRKLLSPNYQSVTNNNSTEITISKANISEAIAWKNGIFSFKKLPLKDIMKTLSRWYNIEVIFTNQKTETIEFTGILGKDQTIEDILSIITNSNNIAYDIDKNTIIFK